MISNKISASSKAYLPFLMGHVRRWDAILIIDFKNILKY